MENSLFASGNVKKKQTERNPSPTGVCIRLQKTAAPPAQVAPPFLCSDASRLHRVMKAGSIVAEKTKPRKLDAPLSSRLFPGPDQS
jgi:hypothetical protein